FTVPSKVRHDQLITRREKPRDRKKELVICRSRMQQNDRWPASRDIVGNGCIIGLDNWHEKSYRSGATSVSPGLYETSMIEPATGGPFPIRRLLCRWRVCIQQIRLIRHDNPCDHITDEAYTSHERRNQPHHTHDGDIDVEVFGKPQAYARN